jgi:hypothetical protein
MLVGTASAQVLSLGLSGGAAFPVGTVDSGSTLGTGWHVGISGRVDPRTARFGLQADVGLASLPYDSLPGHVVSYEAGLAGFYRFTPVTAFLRPYAIVGLGVFYVEEPTRNTITPALNAGVGIEGGTRAIRLFAEARFQYVVTWDDNLRYAPVSLGVRYAFNP